MGKLRQYRRDEERIAKEVMRRGKISNSADFEREFTRYMGKAQQDPTFKENVQKIVSRNRGFKPVRVARRRRTPPVEFAFSGRQKGSRKIFKARFDKKVKRYRNEKGQFVSKSQ